MVRIRLTLAYVGTRFCGWQIQPGCRTVQGCLEKILTRMVGPVRVHGSSRTDSGVHALGQVAHFDRVQKRIPLAEGPQCPASRGRRRTGGNAGLREIPFQVLTFLQRIYIHTLGRDTLPASPEVSICLAGPISGS
ncbi:MAG: hypothetical protein ACOC0U_05190 [Desulfovibrionales bacterium]